MQVSAGIQGDRRLGSIDPGNDADREMIEKLGVKVFDISEFSAGFIGHDNYAEGGIVKQIGASLTAPRAGDDSGQAVIDAGADRSARAPAPAPGSVTASDLPAPEAAQGTQK